MQTEHITDSGILITHIDSKSPLYAEVLALREDVLRKPLGLSLKNEDLSRDHIDIIFIATYHEKVIACLLLHRLDDSEMQLRAMAVYKEWQGKGIGRALVAAAERFCVQNGYTNIMLHARKVAIGFYSGMGYDTVGAEFAEVGIPHYIMKKRIAPF